MSALFRLRGASKRDPAVEAWLAAQQGDLGMLARRCDMSNAVRARRPAPSRSKR